MTRGLKAEFLKRANAAAELFSYSTPTTQNQLTSLPKSLQKFLSSSGYNFLAPVDCAWIQWQDAALKLTETSGWKRFYFTQVNFLWEPVRLVYMRSEALGIFPLEGLDSYLQGHGNMQVRLMRLLTLNNTRGQEMDLAQLVTILAEVMIIPHYALRKYIQWEEIDQLSAKGTINHNSRSASGIFHFNMEGECTWFESEDRYFTRKNNEPIKMKWIARAEKYILKNGIKFPTQYSATWVTEKGNYDYFRGKVGVLS